MTAIVACVPDLMDRSKVAAAAATAVFVPRAGDLVEAARAHGARLAVVDLARPGALAAVAALAADGVRTVGFGSHVEPDVLDAARAAGCDQVLTRANFFRRVGEVLGQAGAG